MKLRRRDQLLRANVLGMIEMVTMDSTNPIVMPSDNSAHAFVFPLETTFQKMARSPRRRVAPAGADECSQGSTAFSHPMPSVDRPK